MSFVVVPDDILAISLCDNCHKYLSVKPITLSLKKITCGRCEKNEEFVESLYNAFGDHLLFKCINRFDGCPKILTFDQVIGHEEICKTNEYVCPACPANTSSIPSYMFPYHIDKQHKKSWLSTNCFTVDLTDMRRNTFFYHKIRDYLFFIQQEFNEEHRSLTLNSVYIGGRGEFKIFQKYEVFIGNYYVTTKEKECVHLDSIHNSEGTNQIINFVDPEVNQKSLIVKFYFNIPAKIIQSIPVPASAVPTAGSSTGNSSAEYFTTQWAIDKAVSYSIETCKLSGCPYARNLYIEETFGEYLSTCKTRMFLDLQSYSRQEKNKRMKNEKISVCFHCVLCKNIRDYDNTLMMKTNSMYYLICSLCVQLLSSKSLIEFKHIMTKNVFETIKCHRPYDYYSHYSDEPYYISFDENIGKISGPKSCCFKGCISSLLNFEMLQEHFQENHKSKIFLSTYPLFEDIFSLTKEIYVLHWNIILCLHVKIIDNDYWLSIDICDKDCPRNYYVFCGLYSREKKLIGILFKSKVKVDFNELKYITFITFKDNEMDT